MGNKASGSTGRQFHRYAPEHLQSAFKENRDRFPSPRRKDLGNFCGKFCAFVLKGDGQLKCRKKQCPESMRRRYLVFLQLASRCKESRDTMKLSSKILREMEIEKKEIQSKRAKLLGIVSTDTKKMLKLMRSAEARVLIAHRYATLGQIKSAEKVIREIRQEGKRVIRRIDHRLENLVKIPQAKVDELARMAIKKGKLDAVMNRTEKSIDKKVYMMKCEQRRAALTFQRDTETLRTLRFLDSTRGRRHMKITVIEEMFAKTQAEVAEQMKKEEEIESTE